MRRSGKHAYVDGICCVQSWQLNQASSVSRYAASCVPGASAASEGNLNWTGTITGVGHSPVLPDGDELPFIGVVSPVDPILNYLADIAILETVINFPIAAGTPITWTANFGVNGEPTKEIATGYTDTCRDIGPSAKLAKISIEDVLDSNTWTDIADVQSATLTFRRSEVTTINDGLTYREVGNLEVDLVFEVDSDDILVPLYEPNSVHRVRVYVNETEFYMFDSIMFSDHTNFQVQREPLSMIGYQVNGLFTALRERTPAALGEILLPNGSTLYGDGST